MKCDRCNGQGFSVIAKWKCPVCGGKGVVEPMTEQEYIQTCNTEQLVEAIYSLVWLNNKLFQQIEMEGHDKETDLKIVREWLKQPHKDTK